MLEDERSTYSIDYNAINARKKARAEIRTMVGDILYSPDPNYDIKITLTRIVDYLDLLDK